MNVYQHNVLDIDELRLSCRQCRLYPVCLPATLRHNELSELAELLGHSDYRRGEHVFNIGDPVHCLYVVREGSVKTWVTSMNGEVQILGFHLPGELIGLDGLLKHRHQCSAEPMEDARVCRLPYVQLEHAMREVPSLQKQLMRLISREFVLEHEHLVLMSGRPALERLGLFLQTLMHRRELLGADPMAFTMSMSRVDLANYLALATETVSRLFARLQRRGVIRLDRRDVEILDRDQLVEISGDDLALMDCVD